MSKQQRDQSIEAAIDRMRRQNMSYQEIQTMLKVSPKRIARVEKSIQEFNLVPDPLPRGKPSKVIPSVREEIRNTTLLNPTFGGFRLARKITELLGISISATTVNIIRHSMHFCFQIPRRQQLLTPKQELKRVEFAEKQLMSNIDWTADVIITDESRFSLHDDSRRVWVKRGIYNPGTFHQQEKFAKSIMVWGAIGKGWRSPLIVVKGNLNTEGYLNLLQENKILDQLNEKYGERKYNFQYDGAPAHRSKKAIEWLQDRANSIPDWPPNSPDLSVIENLWGILKAKLAVRDPQNLKEMEQYLMEEWLNIDQKTIDKLIAETPGRFQMVTIEKGKPIGHLLHKIPKITAFGRMTNLEIETEQELANSDDQIEEKCTPSDCCSTNHENSIPDGSHDMDRCDPIQINVVKERNGLRQGQLQYSCGRTIWIPYATLREKFSSLLIDYLEKDLRNP
jgi:transposase